MDDIAYRKQHVYEIARDRHCTPQVPRITPALLVAVQFPTAKLLIEPPAIRAVSHLDVRQPFGDDRDHRSVDTNATPCVRVRGQGVGGARGFEGGFRSELMRNEGIALTDDADDEP